MITKISGEQPFQVLTGAFSISPSQSGYNLEISADGVNYSPLFTVGAGVTRLVTGVAANSFYRLKGNNSEVSINWMKTCVTEGGGGDMSNYYTKAETDAEISAATSPIQEQLDDVERVTASALTELHNDVLELSGATPDMSNYYTKDEIGIKEEVVSRALNELNTSKVSSTSVSTIWKGTQAEYDAITTPDTSTLYIIINN